MKTFVKWLVVIVWTAMVSVGGFATANSIMQDKVYTGTFVEFSMYSDHFLLIESDSVRFEAVSADFFVLRKLSGETVVGQPETPPIGWTNDFYYHAGPVEIPGGKWYYVGEGTLTAQVTSENAVSIRAIQTETVTTDIASSAAVIGLVVWAVGLVILGALGFYNW